MTMRRRSVSRFAGNAVAMLFVLAGLVAVPAARAQSGSLKFGTPLRSNVVFAYKYVERVTEIHEAGGQLVDSNKRIVTYYISQRQLPSARGNGLIAIEANVDSMEIDQRGMGDSLYFNTQRIELANNQQLVRHRDVFAPSILVNRMVTFHLTSYGQIVKVESPSRDQALEDLKSAPIDPFTRERLFATLTDEHLASVLLPWRGVAPLGRTVAYNKELKIPFWTSFDRIGFRDTARVMLVNGPDDAAHLRYTATLSHTRTGSVTITAFDEPLKLGSATASVSGDLKLDQDGVVISGWTLMNGTMQCMRSGTPIKSRISHEVYFDSIGLAPVTSN